MTYEPPKRVAEKVAKATVYDAYPVRPAYMTEEEFQADLPVIQAAWDESLRRRGLL